MATTATDGPPLRQDSVPVVDLRLLSQSELYTLSQCSDSFFDLNRCDDVVIPKINRSVFNESAGSRKQTYSRLRLASAESSSKTTKTSTLHRRTPHLRPSLTHPSNNINDPEQAENSLIIRMLKQLCKSDPNFQDVDQIEDENDNNNNFVMPEFLNPENLGVKRKRGRPRKHENVVFLRPPNAKRIRNNTVKKVVVYDNDRDREIVNDRGVTVNMATLARLEDPFGPEIRRRTVGMSTEDELLGFLTGLNGQWGSRRKKRRVVDANEFGDALPKGWRLSLCIKKKEGRVWLFCRRYISPSGRQFESCKEISIYLISVIGEENLDKRNQVDVNCCDDFASKEASVNAADVLQEEIKKDEPIDNPSSSSSPPLTTKHEEEQVTLDKDVMDVQIGEGEILECQTCHKTFNDRSQYNDHIECHVKNETDKIVPSLPPTTKLDCDNVEVEPYDAHSGKKSDTDNKQDEHTNEDGNMFIEDDKSAENCLTNEVITTEQAPDVVSQSELLSEVPLSINESDRNPETSGETRGNSDDKTSDCNLDQVVNSRSFQISSFANGQMDNAPVLNHTVSETGVTYVDSVQEKSECILGQGSDSGSGSRIDKDIVGSAISEGLFQKSNIFEEKDFGACMDMQIDSTSNELTSEKEKVVGKDVVGSAVSRSFQKSSIFEDKDFGANMDMQIDSTSNELTSEKEKVVNESSSCGFFLDRFGLDKDGATVVKKLSTKAMRSVEPVKVVTTETLISSEASPQKVDDDKLAYGSYNSVKKLSSSLTSSRLDGQIDLGTNGFSSYGASRLQGVSSFDEEIEFMNKNLRNDVSFSTMEEPRMQLSSENVTRTSSSKPVDAKFDDFQIFTNNEAKINDLNRDVLDFNTKNNLEFCSLVPSENDQPFSFQDDVTSLYNRAMEECKQDSSERGLLDHFSIADTSDDIFENKMYSTSLDGLKFDEERDISSHELSLAFGNPHGLYQDHPVKKDIISCSVVTSKINEPYDVHTNLSMVNNSIEKTGRGSVGGLFNLEKTSGFQNSGNTVYPGRAWQGVKPESSGNKFTTGFGSNHGQTHAEVVPSGMWKSGEGNQLRSGLSNTSHAQIASPSSFHSFNIMSNKAGEGQFRYNENFGVSGLRSSRPEPVEFSFLTGRSQHNPLQGDSRAFSYNPEIEQQFDSSFWLGSKNTMMPNPAARNQIMSVCAWCRNEFHLQPLHSNMQDGIGSLCPNCSAGMSAHVNML